MRLTFALAGLTVLVDAHAGRYDAAYRILVAHDITPQWHDRAGLSFPVRELQNAAPLAEQVRVDADLAALWEAVCNPSADALPATLHARADQVELVWLDTEGVRHQVPVPPVAIPALLAADVAFVAESDAWRLIERHATVPVAAGRAQLNADGFVEIHTATPQLVEASPLPALFRVDDTHFGLPAPLATALDTAKGFMWVGERPAAPREVTLPAALDVSAHARDGARALAAHLEAYKAAAVVWSPGLGRRIAVLAALEALDAWPALVVCDPSAIWLWQRHVEVLGREASFGNTDADVRIVTYHDLPRVALEDPVAIVIDDPYSAPAKAASASFRRFAALRDAVRVAVCASWDDTDAEVVRIMSMLRPSEFSLTTPVAWRYPVRTSERLREHAGAYLLELDSADVPADATASYRRSSIALCQATTPQRSAFAEVRELLEEGEDPETLLQLAEDAASAGTSSSPSPKLAEAVERVRRARAAGRSVAVLVASHKSATRLRMLLKPLRVDAVEEGEDRTLRPSGDVDVVLVRARHQLPSLRAFDEIVVVEYPTSFALLDAAVGASDQSGPVKITVIHLADSIDDRLAINAALARDLGTRRGPLGALELIERL